MSHRERVLAQPQGEDRAKVGSKGEGEYYRIIVRPKDQFTSFRYHDVGDPGNILRLAGRRSSSSWADHARLISKDMAHLQGEILITDAAEAKEILDIVGPVLHTKGDIFKGHPRKNIAQKDKLTKLQKIAWNE